jgi:ribosomal-protein-alanine N-acetyltransferase
MVILTTERLFLRHFHILDSEAIYHVFGDSEVMHFGDGTQTKDWVETWLRTCLERYYQAWGFGPYVVVEKSSRNVIGYCGLFYFPDVNGQPEVEIGYMSCLIHNSRRVVRYSYTRGCEGFMN